MPEGQLYLGDTHVHSTRSDGRLSPAELGVVASAKGLDFFALADHAKGQPAGPGAALGPAEPGGVAVLQGQEISAGDHLHFVLLGPLAPLHDIRLPQLPEVAAEAHAAGAVVVLAHPWTVFARTPERVRQVDRLFAGGHLDGLEVISGALKPTMFEEWRRMFVHYLREWAPYRPATLASSDWHHRAHGRTLALGASYILAESPSGPDLLKGLAARRTVALLPPATGLEDGLYRTYRQLVEEAGEVGPPTGPRWQDGQFGPPDLLDQVASLHRAVAARLGDPACLLRDGPRAEEVRRAALAAVAASNYRRALALLGAEER